jgi:hypothetical protein
LSAPVTRYWPAEFPDDIILSGKTLDLFLMDYDIYYSIEELTKDGRKMSIKDIQIPEPIENYHKYKDRSDYLRKRYTDEVVKQYVHNKYISESVYTCIEYNNYLKQKDPLSYRFLGLLKKELDTLYELKEAAK